MEDVLTEAPPPSRFFQEDLDNFATPSPPLPPPFLTLTIPNRNTPNRNTPNPNNPNILIIAISSPSLSLIRRIPNKTLIGTLTLPETSKSPNKIYSVNTPLTTVIVAVRHPIPPERSRAAAKALLGEIRPGRVLIFDSIKPENYRSRLSSDEAAGFKLETTAERRCGERSVRDWEYFPTGSVMDGLGAAVIGECQARRGRATLCASWPESGWLAAGVVGMVGVVMRGLGLDVDGDEVRDEEEIRVSSSRLRNSELYV